MQLTFILGNGFDRAIGMKTGYWDFYQWYKDQPNESDDVALMKREINEYLKTEEGTWADFEIALGQFTSVISDKVRFIEVFQHARAALIRYLTEQYEQKTRENKDFLKSATYRLIERSQKVTEDLPEDKKSLFLVTKDISTTFNCISFNYTPVLRDGYHDMIDNEGGISNRDGWYGTYKLGKMLNVHGQLDDFPILGVDNPNQIANERFRNDPDILQLMVKGEIDKKLGYNWRTQAQEIIANSDKIYVYGASMGDTDEFWWRTLAKWYEDDIKNHQIAVYCHPNSDEIKMQKNKEHFVNSISKHFTRGDYRANVVIDSVEKTMTMGFKYINMQAEARIHIEASLEMVSASELRALLENPCTSSEEVDDEKD